MVKHVNTAQLKELLSGDKPVVCDFWSMRCPPCRMLAPIFESVSDKFGDEVRFVKLDVDENDDAAIEYGITAIPNVILFKNGKAAATSLGFVPEETLRSFVEKNR